MYQKSRGKPEVQGRDRVSSPGVEVVLELEIGDRVEKHMLT